MKKKIALLLIIGLLSIVADGYAQQSAIAKFPEKTINVVVPWPAGGRSDAYARALAPLLEEKLNVPVIVSNHAGAAGAMGARAVLKAGADGYTLLSVGGGTMSFKVTRTPPVDAEKFEPIGNYVYEAYFVAVRNDSPFKTYQDLINFAKQNPGKVKCGTAGIATDGDLYIRELADMAGVRINVIPYAGDAPLTVDLLGGHVDAAMTVIPSIFGQLEAKQFRLLASGYAQPHPDFPGVPTFKSLGYDLVGDYWSVFAAPEGTPPEILDKLEQALKYAVENPKFKEFVRRLHSEAMWWDRHKSKKVMQETIKRDIARAQKFGLASK